MGTIPIVAPRRIGRLNRLRALLVFGMLVGTACGSNSASEANRTVDTTGQAATTIDVPEALRFRAPLVGGGEIDMSTLADKPVVLWFWAPY